MKKIFLLLVLAVALAVGFAAVPVPARADLSDAANALKAAGTAATTCSPSGGLQGGVNCTAGAKGLAKGSLPSYIKIITNVLLSAVGVIAVIMIIIGGFRYALSAGDENAVKGAKDTILYAVVGLVVAILAFVIVNFVLQIFF